MAVNHSAINNIYNYYLTTYAPKSDSKFDTHKKSELRGVYNSIVNINKDAPLYIVDKSQATKAYAIGIKENARAFRNTIASLGGLDDDKLLAKKAAFSSNESIAEVSYIGDDLSGEGVPSFDLAVTSLAKQQVNTGRYLISDSIALKPDTYSFDVAVNGLNYEFQYNVNPDDTNKTVQEKLSRLISNANIGLKANVDYKGGTSALVITSDNTGRGFNGGRLFGISDNNTSRTKGSVAYFGLDNTTQESANAHFMINGVEREAQGNEFTVQKLYEIHLLRESADAEDTTHISLQADYESMISNVTALVDGYNEFVDAAGSFAPEHPKSRRLVNEMQSLAMVHTEALERVGLEIKDDGHLQVDRSKLIDAMSEDNFEENLEGIKRFTGSMLRKTNEVSINPMNYTDRTIAAYKNPGHNFATPYVTSAYTGMMFSGYC